MTLADHRAALAPNPEFPKARGRRCSKPKPGEVPSPGLAVWEFTLACDHGCLHCGPRAGRARADELDTADSLRLVAELAAMGVGEVVLIGGEAYLRNDILEVIREIRMQGMACALTTGGLNLSQARLDAMIEAGLQNACVSIDGLRPNHDYVRGREGSWAAAESALRRIVAAGIQCSVNTQINALSMYDLAPLLEHLASLGVNTWQIHPTAAHGNAAEHPEILLQPYMYLELYTMIEGLLDRAQDHGIRVYPGNGLGYFGPLEHRLRGHLRGCGHFDGCDAGRRAIAIESHGAIKGCPSLGGPSNIAGRWPEQTLQAIWRESTTMRYVRERTVDDLWGYCATCYYADHCKAGCTATAEPLMGRPGNNPMCWHRAREMQRMGLRERVERVAGPSSDAAFAMGKFRVIRESLDAAKREREGPVAIEEPRCERLIEPGGTGYAWQRRVGLPVIP